MSLLKQIPNPFDYVLEKIVSMQLEFFPIDHMYKAPNLIIQAFHTKEKNKIW